MIPDIKTLMLLYLVTNVINAGAIAVIWNQNRRRFAGYLQMAKNLGSYRTLAKPFTHSKLIDAVQEFLNE